jgi:hypothetical protein
MSTRSREAARFGEAAGAWVPAQMQLLEAAAVRYVAGSGAEEAKAWRSQASVPSSQATVPSSQASVPSSQAGESPVAAR